MSVDVRTHMTRGHGRKKSPDVSQHRPVLPTANSPVSSNALAVSAARVHAPTDSHSLDTELTAVARLTIPGLTSTIWALATKF